MKVLISTDMEGISGVVNWDHVRPGHAEWVRFRDVMTADVNAAIRGAYEAGAEAVFVSDGHWNATNILREKLDARAWLNSGAPLPLSKMQGIDSGVDGVMFVGYHARAGTHPAVLDHTWTDSVLGVWLNGLLVGEIGLDAALAGHFNVPVIMLSGDQSASKEVQQLISHDVEVAVVKKARGRFSAALMPLPIAREKICEAAARAVTRLRNGTAPNPFVISPPVTLAIEFARPDLADRVQLAPGTRRVDGRRVDLTTADMAGAYQAMRELVMLAGE